MRWTTTRLTILTVSAALTAPAAATPPAGVVSNVIVAQGPAVLPIKERADVGGTWSLTLEDRGGSDIYFTSRTSSSGRAVTQDGTAIPACC